MRRLVFPGRYQAYRFVSAVLGEEPLPFTIPISSGYHLKVNSPFWQHMFYLGDYEWDVRHFLEKTVNRDSVVFDVGASIGVVTIPLAIRAKRVFAFDALESNFELLKENLFSNSLENVFAVHAAVSDESEMIRVPCAPRNGNYSLASTAETYTTVQALTLDDFCEWHNIHRVDVMKIDIEGSETRALRGSKRLFTSGAIKKVLIEFNGYWLRKMGSSPDELYDLFEAYNLKVSRLTKTGGTRPISRTECMARLARPGSYFNLVLSP